jgi:hypothetical protein
MTPYMKAVKMWKDGKTLGDIADELGVDTLNEFIRRGVLTVVRGGRNALPASNMRG